MMKLVRILAAVAAAAVVSIAFVLPASAATGTIPLNNDRASADSDCPAGGGTYWHFVLAPNNGQFSFTTITLNLGTETRSFTGSQIIPNGTQTDNVFIAVPAGFTLTSLVASGSSAQYSATGTRTPNRFNLSHVCPGYTGGVSPSVLGETVSRAPETPGAVVESATAVRSAGALPYTGSNSTVPFVQVGVALLAVGALLVFVVRKRTLTPEA